MDNISLKDQNINGLTAIQILMELIYMAPKV